MFCLQHTLGVEAIADLLVAGAVKTNLTDVDGLVTSVAWKIGQRRGKRVVDAL